MSKITNSFFLTNKQEDNTLQHHKFTFFYINNNRAKTQWVIKKNSHEGMVLNELLATHLFATQSS